MSNNPQPWFCMAGYGTVDSLTEASEFVRVLEKRQGIKISALEEIAWRNGWISREKLLESAQKFGNSAYGAHLRAVAEGRILYQDT